METTDTDTFDLPNQLLRKDLREAARTLSTRQVRYLVDTYYAWQDNRKASSNQLSAMKKAEEPYDSVDWTMERMGSFETDVRAMLDVYTQTEKTGMGMWAREICGIGPVISAGLLAHIDITKAPTAGHIWRYAGLDPTVTWKKGEKRPWNAGLKVLCWKIGESFVKVKGNSKDRYGKLYDQRKAVEQAKNEAGEYTEQAKRALTTKNFSRDTEAKKWYERGMLPPGHIHARAKRYATKIFLSHWHAEAYRRHFGTEPPAPYAIAILGHAHFLAP